jgi:hypothetical protein
VALTALREASSLLLLLLLLLAITCAAPGAAPPPAAAAESQAPAPPPAQKLALLSFVTFMLALRQSSSRSLSSRASIVMLSHVYFFQSVGGATVGGRIASGVE